MPQLKLFLFGSPGLERDNQAIKVRGRKVLALAAYLAVYRQPHNRDTLAALLWPEHDQSGARANLRRELSRLNRLLGDGQLDIDRESAGLSGGATLWLDVGRFRQHLGAVQSHDHPADETCADCLPHLRRAAALYTADFLAGFTLPDSPGFNDWQFFESEGLRQELASALKRLIRINITLAQLEEAITHARRWLALDPLHEPAVQQLMRLYAWANQQAAALRQYQETVRFFGEEMGAPPSDETTALYEAIKAKRLPIPIEAGESINASQVQQTGIGAREVLSLPFPSPPESPHSLPQQATPFVGREAELVALEGLFADENARLVTIVGPGGMGKTRLSIKAAFQSLTAFPDGVIFVPLAPISSAEFLISAIIDSLTINFYQTTDTKRQLLDYLRNKSMLLVLDNFEQLLDGAGLLSELVLAAPLVKLLVTSRERLNLQEEWVFELHGMAYPAHKQPPSHAAPSGEHASSSVPLTRTQDAYSALDLFEQRARQVHADFDLAAEYLAIVRICQCVNGMPLGLELAAAWLKVMSSQEIAVEIEKNLDFLATAMRNVPERHRSLRAVFRQSWRLLSDEEKSVFKKLSVFRGGFSREAAEQVAGASLPLLAALVDKSLLRRTDPGRYEIHELVRQYAAERLQSVSEESNVINAAHARYYADFLYSRRDDLRGARQYEALAEIAAELENVRVSWAWAVEQADINLIGKSIDSLYFFSEGRGRARDTEVAVRQAVARLTEGTIGQGKSPVVEHQLILGRLLFRQGDLCNRIGRWDQGLALEQQALLIFRQVEQGAEEDLASLLNKLAITVFFRGEPDQAKELVQEALQLATSVGDKIEMAYAYNVMGHLAEFQGEYLEAGPAFEESIRQYNEIGESLLCAYARNNWGRAAYAMGDYDHAEALIGAALKVRREFGDLVGMSYSQLDLGKLAKMRGQYIKADQYIQEALSIAEEIGLRDTVARCYHGMGMVAEGLGDFERAEALHQQSLTIYREIGVKRALPLTFNHLSRAAYERGEYQLAQQRLRDSLAACEEMENRAQRASALRHLGHVAVATDNNHMATQFYQQALRLLIETGARSMALDVLVGWATLLTKNAPTEAEQAQIVELLTLVQHHFASEYETREKAKRLLTEWTSTLPPEALASTQTRGRNLDLWEVAKALQAELAESGRGNFEAREPE